ncbi:MAG: hypothetical protein AAGC56_10155 [Pseudomonadota bacterium]
MAIDGRVALKRSLHRTLLFFAASACLAGGCATTVTTGEPARAVQTENRALAEAAAVLGETRWPKPTRSSFNPILIGFGGGGEGLDRADAVGIYATLLKTEAAPLTALLDHANAHVVGARDLALLAESVAAGAAPVMGDVVIMETAIAEMRRCREIYARTATELTGDGAAARAIRADFGAAIRQLGDAADLLAARASAERDLRRTREAAGLPARLM